MIKKNIKGFTIVELVIVIAVVAVLASVLIPTFSSLIDKANQSADLQAVRQMNTALATESVIVKPTDVEAVIRILAAAGFNAQDKLVPVTAKHGFYWCEAANLITLIKDEGDGTPTLIFPVDDETINNAFNTAKINWTNVDKGFLDLEPNSKDILPPTLEGDGNGGNGGDGGNGNGDGEGPGTPEDSNTPVTEVTLNQTTVTLDINGTVTLTATVLPEGATNKTVTWTVTQEGTVIEFDKETGVVTAKGAGTATITVTTEDGSKTATCTVTVSSDSSDPSTVPVSEVKLNLYTAALVVGKTPATVTLAATVLPEEATNKTVTWTVTQEGTVIEFDTVTGVVTAKGAGTATITATVADGSGKTATCTVTVTDPNAISTDDQLKTALETGGTGYYLMADVAVTSATVINSEVTLDLNGKTLTLKDPSTDEKPDYPITVQDTLNVVNNSADTGTIIIDQVTVSNDLAYYVFCGINNLGTLNLDGVNIICNRMCNIENYGEIELTNSTLTVNAGYGLYNEYTAEVKDCTMIAKGEYATQLCNYSGTMNVTDTVFSEGDNFVSYCDPDNPAPIECHDMLGSGSTLTLENVTVTFNVSSGNGNYSVLASNGSNLVIKSGEFEEKIRCAAGATAYISGGTFNGIAYENFTTSSDIFTGDRHTLTKDETNNRWVISAAS